MKLLIFYAVYILKIFIFDYPCAILAASDIFYHPGDILCVKM